LKVDQFGGLASIDFLALIEVLAVDIGSIRRTAGCNIEFGEVIPMTAGEFGKKRAIFPASQFLKIRLKFEVDIVQIGTTPLVIATGDQSRRFSSIGEPQIDACLMESGASAAPVTSQKILLGIAIDIEDRFILRDVIFLCLPVGVDRFGGEE
jgi:hypothetical protein